MNGIHIRQVFITGVMLGFLYNEEQDINDGKNYNVLTICFFIIGINITWW